MKHWRELPTEVVGLEALRGRGALALSAVVYLWNGSVRAKVGHDGLGALLQP